MTDSTLGNTPSIFFQLPKSHVASFFAGCVAGACGVTVGHPFDSLKVRLQVGEELVYEKVNWYVIKQLYRGIVPPLLTVGTLQAINFSNYELFKREIPKYLYAEYDEEFHPKNVDLTTVFLAGVGSGFVMSTITTPLNIIKIRMQVASEAGVWSCFRDVYKMGPKTFYRGYGSAFITEAPGRGVYLWVYEYTKLLLVRYKYPDYQHVPNRIVMQTEYVDIYTRIISAASAGILSWLSVYPLDVIKSKVQLDIAGVKYKNSWDCILKTWKAEGFLGFFRGLSYTLIRAGPVSATILPTYDLTKEYFEKHIW
jgi:solute carrier family 25 carnitine/acylcarnitine transporter 20/29